MQTKCQRHISICFPFYRSLYDIKNCFDIPAEIFTLFHHCLFSSFPPTHFLLHFPFLFSLFLFTTILSSFFWLFTHLHTHPKMSFSLLSFCSFVLEPLLPKKQHFKSQDKLDRDEPEKDRKEKRKEKRNSKHQEIFDKELKATDIPMQPTEAVILSETVRERLLCWCFLVQNMMMWFTKKKRTGPWQAHGNLAKFYLVYSHISLILYCSGSPPWVNKSGPMKKKIWVYESIVCGFLFGNRSGPTFIKVLLTLLACLSHPWMKLVYSSFYWLKNKYAHNLVCFLSEKIKSKNLYSSSN